MAYPAPHLRGLYQKPRREPVIVTKLEIFTDAVSEKTDKFCWTIQPAGFGEHFNRFKSFIRL